MSEIHAFDTQVKLDENSLYPKHPFSAELVAGRGGGKTSLMLNWLTNPKMLGETFHKIWWVSPTVRLDSKVRDVLRKHDKTVIVHNFALEKAIRKELEDEEVRKSKEAKLILTDPKRPGGREKPAKDFKLPQISLNDDAYFPGEINENWIRRMLAEQDAVIRKYGKPLADKILIIFDDCLSSKVLLTSVMQRLVAEGRHHSISTIFSLQMYKNLPKPFRLNSDVLVVFGTNNRKELSLIYEETTCGLSFDDWLAIFRYCTNADYGFIEFNFKNQKRYRIINTCHEYIDLDAFK